MSRLYKYPREDTRSSYISYHAIYSTTAPVAVAITKKQIVFLSAEPEISPALLGAVPPAAVVPFGQCTIDIYRFVPIGQCDTSHDRCVHWMARPVVD
jgi:hypothetical protein